MMVVIYLLNKEGMKRLIIISALMAIPLFSQAYSAGLAFKTEKNSLMQVVVNGKVCNTSAKNFVRVKGNPGLYHVEITVLNPYDKVWYKVRKDVRVDKGYEFYYKIVFANNRRPTIEFVNRFPSFYNYYNPALTYKNPIA
jgi:hypothetical protein